MRHGHKINKKIAETRHNTIERRSKMICKTYVCKVDESRLNQKQKKSLHMMFLEAKWLYNHILRNEEIFNTNLNNKQVTVLDKNQNKGIRNIKYLMGTYRRKILDSMKQSIYSLAKLREKGFKIGPLQFKKEFTTLDLVNHGKNNNYEIKGNNKIRILGIKKPLIVRGVNQFPKDCEFGPAKLIKKSNGYFIYATAYSKKGEIIKEENENLKNIGIDFGIKNTVTTSEGKVYNASVPESERLKRLQRKFEGQKKGSKNRIKTIQKIRREYAKMGNQKFNLTNKIVHEILSTHNIVYIQDDDFREWQEQKEKGFGKVINHGCLGRIKNKFKESSKVKIVEKYFPSTKLCYICGTFNEISLGQRIFECSNCNHKENRDTKAAKTILLEGQGKLIFENRKTPTEHREEPVETNRKTSYKRS
jgi:putative transposase